MKKARRLLLATMPALVAGMLVLAGVAWAQQGPHEGDVGAQVVGGKPVPDGKYPFMAALEGRFPEEPGGEPTPSTPFQQYCGGSLIDPSHVMTAAHCVEFIGVPGDLPLTDFQVVVGRTVLGSDQGEVRRVERLRDIAIHPRYAPRFSFAYDVAVIELARPVDGIEPIKPATARQDFLEQPGRLATVAGWGNTRPQPPFGSGGENFPRRLRQAEVPLVSDTEGRKAYGRVYNPVAMIAAGKKGKDTCNRDSGGPMFDRVSGQYWQIGITNFGFGCATKPFPGVYAEVNAPSIRDFIRSAASG